MCQKQVRHGEGGQGIGDGRVNLAQQCGRQEQHGREGETQRALVSRSSHRTQTKLEQHWAPRRSRVKPSKHGRDMGM